MSDTSREFAEIRKAMGFSQVEMAVAMGVRQPTICRWETGKHAPDTRTMIAARALLATRKAAA